VTGAPNRNLRYALFVLGCAVLSVALRLPVLSSGFIADDYVQIAMIDGTYPVKRASWDLYNFSDGTAAESDALRHRGFFPWFTHREIRLSMFRPLSSELLALDFRLFGNDPFPYHVHSALWWVALLLAVAWLFGELLPRPVAFSGVAFFAVDDASIIPFAWIANRCSLTSALWGVLGLIAYVRYRERAKRRLAAAASTACFALAVAFGEYGLCFVAYVAAYELVRWLDARRDGAHAGRSSLAALAAQALATWPVIVPSLAFLATRRALGRGPLHSGTYIGPEGDVLGYIGLIAERLPVLFADLFFFIPSEPWNYGNLLLRGLYQQGMLDMRWLWTADRLRAVYSVVGALAIVIALVAWGVVRRQLGPRVARERSHVRWLAAGSVLSLVPVVGSFPSTRLLIIAAVGFAALLGTLAVLCFRDLRRRFEGARVRTVVACLAGGLVVALHLLLPAQLTAVHAAGFKSAAAAMRRTIMKLDADPRRLPLQRVVVLSALEYGTSLYIPIVLARHGRKPPRSCWTLSFAPAPHILLRESPTSFMLTPANGYAMLANAPELLFMDPSAPFESGDVVDLGGLRITVLATAGPRIQSIRVETDVPLDDRSLLFVIPTAVGIRRFSMPRVGEIAHVPEAMVPPW
jgi:hypothetical protein